MSHTHGKPWHLRNDIQGLRALAVGLVILFHLGLSPVSGGFVGVDIFFTISGFLITRVILSTIRSDGSYDYQRFYLGRIRRLFPALLATVVATIIAAVILDFHLDSTLQSSFFAITHLSNIYFWMESGYFDSASITKPLLHTWSLSVEEQFYLIWPLLLVLSTRLLPSRKHLWTILAMVGAGSFALNYAFSEFGEALFFLFPFRIFEFAIGALALFAWERWTPKKIISDLLCAVGLLSIIASALIYNHETAFPKVAALLPCGGVALILFCGEKSGLIKALISNSPMVYLGKISYSLYLVHWPIVVFIMFLTQPDAVQVSLPLIWVAAALGMTVVGALLLFYCVEEPLRRPSNKGEGALSQTAFALVCALSALVALVAVEVVRDRTQATPPQVIVLEDQGVGGEDRHTRAAQFAADYNSSADQQFTWHLIRNLQVPYREVGKRVLVIGDSQGADFMNLLEHHPAFWEGNIRTFASSKHCQIMFSEAFYDNGHYRGRGEPPRGILNTCSDKSRQLREDSRLASAETIVLAYAWFPEAMPYLENEIAALRTLTDAEILVVGRKDQPDNSIKLLQTHKTIDAGEKTAGMKRHLEISETEAAIINVVGTKSYIDLYSVFCRRKRCHHFTDTGAPIFYDSRHLTRDGAAFVGKKFEMLGIGDTLLSEQSD